MGSNKALQLAPLFLYGRDERRELKVFEDLLRSKISLLTVICSRT